MKELIVKNENKILLIVLDGLGGLPINGKTELETAKTPNLDELTRKSELGLTISVDYGITPGSGPGHLAIFGYDPLEIKIGRGVLEALGLGLRLEENTLAIRGNFATFKDGKIISRRAGRISSEENRRLCEKLRREIKYIKDYEIEFHSGIEHRFVVLIKGKDLSEEIKETDPQKDGLPPYLPEPLSEEGKKTSEILKILIERGREVLKEEKEANYFLLRGYSKVPKVENFCEKYQLKSLAIATYPMYKGIASLIGMDVVKSSLNSWEEEIEELKRNYQSYDFFYLHFKEIDTAGEDGDFEKKVLLIEKFDSLLPEILKLNFSVIAITSDHSTPALLKSHSWHPSPFLLYSPFSRNNEKVKFCEKNCQKGSLGVFKAQKILPLLLAYSLRLKKFGA
ncbi:MAG: 2,3-bisphosphoglycerate-independent phosphoglycerate mutase [candidate division WOR-3 bacterium]|nr:2,3-bisphosphoglycerate-independent phosphoglycerate mutase [candidate division WOR-3 bacterium]MCX7837208.1 2,3-bisphosphoglycerate-independent phosphoglycerate mutase [candidate division WOR-3 bacterium]MDW8114600.1 2,3-bisphosphoglycerate-independent phosphoglycerate mutase [candidate division WOR-3 bacterium]